MTRCRYILSAIAVAGLAIAVLVMVEMMPLEPGVTQASFDQIEDGMTLSEVEAILGRPPDFSGKNITGQAVHMWKSKSGSSATVMISKDGEGVFGKIWPEAEETIVRRIRHSIFPPPALPNK
jgi:hypothetical protein